MMVYLSFREVIIRTAFQSMQLVVTDFLSLISPLCLSLCVEMAAKFGLQQSELNISLTAIGLLVSWASTVMSQLNSFAVMSQFKSFTVMSQFKSVTVMSQFKSFTVMSKVFHCNVSNLSL